MKLSTFIVVDDYKRIKTGGICEHTVNGAVIYPLETPLPIIQKGKGCIGIGMISEVNMTTSSTRIVFKVSKVNIDDGNAYYRLYQNQVSAVNDDDAYDAAADMVIPGMMMGKSTRSSGRDLSESRRSRSKSLSDFMRDNDLD